MDALASVSATNSSTSTAPVVNTPASSAEAPPRPPTPSTSPPLTHPLVKDKESLLQRLRSGLPPKPPATEPKTVASTPPAAEPVRQDLKAAPAPAADVKDDVAKAETSAESSEDATAVIRQRLAQLNKEQRALATERERFKAQQQEVAAKAAAAEKLQAVQQLIEAKQWHKVVTALAPDANPNDVALELFNRLQESDQATLSLEDVGKLIENRLQEEKKKEDAEKKRAQEEEQARAQKALEGMRDEYGMACLKVFEQSPQKFPHIAGRGVPVAVAVAVADAMHKQTGNYPDPAEIMDYFERVYATEWERQAELKRQNSPASNNVSIAAPSAPAPAFTPSTVQPNPGSYSTVQRRLTLDEKRAQLKQQLALRMSQMKSR